ncbi:FIST N-terminal domain-containing protein [Enhygromyxa salina]|uniref:FIST N-terminal domain-containing protein n=1 Tax=Enhygromyxa salina TaxID=215803 RepID=UPI003B8A65AC
MIVVDRKVGAVTSRQPRCSRTRTCGCLRGAPQRTVRDLSTALARPREGPTGVTTDLIWTSASIVVGACRQGSPSPMLAPRMQRRSLFVSSKLEFADVARAVAQAFPDSLTLGCTTRGEIGARWLHGRQRVCARARGSAACSRGVARAAHRAEVRALRSGDRRAA